MRKILILLSSLITLSFTLILVAVLYAANLNPNDHKDWISDKFLETTGRAIDLEGNIELTLYPWLGLELNQVTVSNAPGFGIEPLLYTEQAVVRIKLMPMLQQQYEIDTVLLSGSNINLAVNDSGQSNWSDLSSATTNADAENTSEGGFALSNVVLGGVNIQNASVNFDDRSTDRHIEISNLTITTGELLYGEPVQLNIALNATSSRPDLATDMTFAGTVIYDLDGQQYELSPLSLNGTVSGPNIPDGSTALSLTTALSLNLANDTLSLRNLEFDALGTHLSANINGQNIQTETPAYDADVALNGEDLALLFRIAEINDLADQIENINSRGFDFSASVSTDLQAGDITLSGLEANLLGANISGNIVATNIQSDTPGLTGQLTANGPDLPTLLGVAGQIQGGSTSSLSQYGRQLNNISNKRFSIDADFDADFRNGNISAPALNAVLLGFTLNGNLNAQNMNESTGTINGELTLNGDNVGEVLAAMGQDGLADVTQSINLSMGLGGNRRNLNITPMELNLVLAGSQIPNSPVNLAVKANSTLSLDDDTLEVNNFSILGLGLDTSGDLQATNISDQIEFTGNLNIMPFNLRRLLSQLNQPIPVTSDSSTLQRVSIGSSFQGSASDIRLSNLSAVLDDSSLAGSLSVTDFESPAIEFTIELDQIDADRYLPPRADTSASTDNQSADLPVDNLRSLNTRGELSIGQLNISGLSITDMQAGLNAAGGQIELSPLQANLYQGRYSGALNLDVIGNTPLLNVESSFQEVALEPLMNDFMDASYVSGSGNINFSLNGRGTDISAIKSSLNGSGNVDLHEGILQGVDVGNVLTQVETMIRSSRLQEIDRGEETPFNNFTASIAINNGSVSSNDLLIEAPGFQVSGRGTLIDLNSESINYQLLTSVDESTATSDTEEFDIGGYNLPIICTGTINSPRCVPDVEDIIASAIQRAVGRGLNSLLERALGVEDAPATENTSTTNETSDTEEAEQEQAEPQSLEGQLINRALDRLFR
jgi:AsmA protein